MEGSQEPNSCRQANRFSRRSSNRSSLDSTSPQINNTQDYFNQLQKILNDQSYHEGDLLKSLEESLSGGTQQQTSLMARQPKDNRSHSNQKNSISTTQSPQKVSTGALSSLQMQELQDASKKSTSPPSSVCMQAAPGNDHHNLNLQIQKITSSSTFQQTLMEQLLGSFSQDHLSEQQRDLVSRLQSNSQQLRGHIQKLETNQQPTYIENDPLLKPTPAKEAEPRFREETCQKIKSELDKEKTLKLETISYFGSTQKFVDLFDGDQQELFGFIKHLNAKIKDQTHSSRASISVESASKQKLDSISQLNKPKQMRRKNSDPKFDNEEYQSLLEDKLMKQFEQQFLQVGHQEERNIDEKERVVAPKQGTSLQQQKDIVKNSITQQLTQDKTQTKASASKKKKRMGSEDKYDKKEYQERMEKNFLQVLTQQFNLEEEELKPVERYQHQIKKQQLSKLQQPLNVAQNLKDDQDERTDKNVVDNQVEEVDEEKTPTVMKETLKQPSHKKQRSSRILHIQMPEEEFLTGGKPPQDSDDRLEDPTRNINFFDIDDFTQNLNSARHFPANQLDDFVAPGVETPAFGKKKTPSLFKREPEGSKATHVKHKSSRQKSQSRQEKSIDEKHSSLRPSNSTKAQQNQTFTYDTWQKEVKRIFSKNPQPPMSTQSSQNRITWHNEEVPCTAKKRSPRNTAGKTRNAKQDASIVNGSAGKEKTVRPHTSQSFFEPSVQSITPKGKGQRSPNASHSKDNFSKIKPKISTFRSREDQKKYQQSLNQSSTTPKNPKQAHLSRLVGQANNNSDLNLPTRNPIQRGTLELQSVKNNTHGGRDMQIDMQTNNSQIVSARATGTPQKLTGPPKSRNTGQSKSPSLR